MKRAVEGRDEPRRVQIGAAFDGMLETELGSQIRAMVQRRIGPSNDSDAHSPKERR